MPLPPIVMEQYTADQYRYIAGFILRQRRGVLLALQSVSNVAAAEIPRWQDPQIRYYEDLEAWSRFLLWVCGYPVEKGQNYMGDTISVYPFPTG